MTARGASLERWEGAEGGWGFLLRYFNQEYGENRESREAARRVLFELSIFYLLILIGFGALYLTWRSNSRLKEWKVQVERTIANQRGRAFEPQDAAKLYGLF